MTFEKSVFGMENLRKKTFVTNEILEGNMIIYLPTLRMRSSRKYQNLNHSAQYLDRKYFNFYLIQAQVI